MLISRLLEMPLFARSTKGVVEKLRRHNSTVPPGLGHHLCPRIFGSRSCNNLGFAWETTDCRQFISRIHYCKSCTPVLTSSHIAHPKGHCQVYSECPTLIAMRICIHRTTQFWKHLVVETEEMTGQVAHHLTKT